MRDDSTASTKIPETYVASDLRNQPNIPDANEAHEAPVSVLDWIQVRDDLARSMDQQWVEVRGWMIPFEGDSASFDYFLLSADEPCCGGCGPRDPLKCVEVFSHLPLPFQAGPIGVRGRLLHLPDDPAGWRYQLVSAHLRANSAQLQRVPPAKPGRRVFMASSMALGLAACAPGRFTRYTEAPASAASVAASVAEWQPSPGILTIDMHSHAGRVIVSRNPSIGANRAFLPLSQPMRAGGMNVICLAIVTDTLVTHVSADRKRFEAWRAPAPGELYALGQIEFARAQQLIEREHLHVVTDAASLKLLGSQGPCVIISAEGADFLEGRLDRVDAAYAAHRLRHLQLTHYRVNELGDIQTETPQYGGLTDFGAAVVRRCNSLGIVVDVAHGTYALVKRAAAVTTKPLVLSHTALASHPRPRSRLITADHARAIADTGGVVGVWPSAGTFRDIPAMANGIKRMVDLIGINHVGLGTDMLGFISPPVFRSYEQLPELGAALLRTGFSHSETGQLLGGNYQRVFEASLA